MITFLEEFVKCAGKWPDAAAVVDCGGKRRTSYAKLDEISGRIASWLKKQGIGTEDVVAICVERGMAFIAVRLAVMKLGAAWVGTEAIMGSERIAYIIKDSGACLVFDGDCYEKAVREIPLPGEEWSDPDPHDLAFIYYTSGSTGKPKGVAEEYGIYPYIMHSTRRAIDRWSFIDYANVSPETYIGGIDLMIGILQAGSTLHLIPLELLRNPAGLLDYFREQHIDASCMPPTLIKVLEGIGGLDLKVLHVAGEIASDLYIDRFPVRNAYGPTEIAYLPFFFDIDKPYSVTPIGTPDENTEVILVNEKGEADAKEGMLCIRLPYFRGYLHDRDRKELICVNGKQYFRTGDYSGVDENGNYTILGRVDDMVKINGNRIEPAEVEAAMKKVLAADFAAVRLWERNGSRFLCGYHTTGRMLDAAQMAEKLRDMLPSYMIPSCYVSIEDIPLNENGKVNKLALPEPDDSLLFAPFSPAENDMQRRVLELFSHELGIRQDRIGIDDDFFLLGGNSLGAIGIVAKAGIEGLTVSMIYSERTARNICLALEDAKTGDVSQPPGADDQGFLLTQDQLYYLERSLQAGDRMIFHLPLILEFDKNTDEKKLGEAVVKAFEAHPALLTVIKKTEDGWRQFFRPENNTDLEAKRPSDREPKPFAFDGSPLFFRELVRTPEKLVLFLDVHHIICDGTSLRILAEDILSAYEGKYPACDAYFDGLRKRLQYAGTDGYSRDMEFFENLCLGEHSRLPLPDMDGGECIRHTHTRRFSFTAQRVRHCAERLHLSVTAFYMLSAALAVASYNGTEDVMLYWTYQGRKDCRDMRTVGLLIRDYPMTFCFGGDDTVADVSSVLTARLRDTILHGNVSPFIRDGKNDLSFVYQGDLQKMPPSEILTDILIPETEGEAVEEPMAINIYEVEENPEAGIDYDGSMYLPGSMERFAEMYERICLLLLEENSRSRRVKEIMDEASC